MTAHDPKALPRVRIKYHTISFAHSVMLHLPSGTDITGAGTTVNSFVNGMKGLLRASGEGFDGWDYIQQGTNVGLSQNYTAVAGTNTTTGSDANLGMGILCFSGKTSLGTKVRLFMACSVFGLEGDMKIARAEASIVATALNYLQGASLPFVGIDGNNINWHDYATWNISRHYIKVRRKLGTG